MSTWGQKAGAASVSDRYSSTKTPSRDREGAGRISRPGSLSLAARRDLAAQCACEALGATLADAGGGTDELGGALRDALGEALMTAEAETLGATVS